MSRHDEFHWNPTELVSILRSHFLWWAAPAVVCAVLAAGYSLLVLAIVQRMFG